MSKITVKAADEVAVPRPMHAGAFYRHKMSHQLVFVSSRHLPDTELVFKGEFPDKQSAVSAIGGGLNGWTLMGLFGSVDDYEEVDVDIVVRPRS